MKYYEDNVYYKKDLYDNNFEVKFDFSLPCKYILFDIKFFNSTGIEIVGNYVDFIKITFEDETREHILEDSYYHRVVPYKFGASSLLDNQYMISYALNPFNIQPSGSSNFNLISSAKIIVYPNSFMLNLINNNSYTMKVNIYGYCYNIMRINCGYAGLVFIDRLATK